MTIRFRVEEHRPAYHYESGYVSTGDSEFRIINEHRHVLRSFIHKHDADRVCAEMNAAEHKRETLYRWHGHVTGSVHGNRKVACAGAMHWPYAVRHDFILVDAGYCLDAPDTLPIGGDNLPAYGAGLTLRDGAFA